MSVKKDKSDMDSLLSQHEIDLLMDSISQGCAPEKDLKRRWIFKPYTHIDTDIWVLIPTIEVEAYLFLKQASVEFKFLCFCMENN